MGSLYSYIEKDGKRIHGNKLLESDIKYEALSELPECCLTCGRFDIGNSGTSGDCVFLNKFGMFWWIKCNYYELDPIIKEVHEYTLNREVDKE